MPIKFPKFSRRKSAGNTLQAGYEPANPDNRFTPSQEADEVGRAPTYRGGYTGAQRQNRYEPSPSLSWLGKAKSVLRVEMGRRGSGYTGGSGHSGSDYYASTGSLNRLSSSSTLPSADIPRTPDDYRNQPSNPSNTTKSPNSGTSSGKRSFGGNYGPISPTSMSTATPPRLDTTLDTSSLFGDDMFSFTTSKTSSARPSSGGGIGHTAPKLASNSIINTSDNHNDITPVPPPKSYNPSASPITARFSYAAYSNLYASSHIDGDRPGATEYSPYGWGGKDTDELVSPIMPAANKSPRNSRNLTPGQSLPTPSHSHSDSLTTPTARQSRLPRQHPPRGGSGDSLGLKRNTVLARRQSSPEDEDAALVAHSAASHKNQTDRRFQPQRSNPASQVVGSAKGLTDKVKDRDSGWDEGVASGSSSVNSYPGNSSSISSHDTRATSLVASKGNTDVGSGQTDTTPRAKKPGAGFSVQLRDGNDIDFDSSISASAALAARYQETEPPKPQQKIMTPAQFERYRQQQDDQRRISGNQAGNDESDESESSESEEESEAERNREALKQRQKQEAHLAVYRQQMMKITGSPGEQPLGMNSRVASISTSVLPLNTAVPRLGISGPGSSGKSSEEEDEEIPLGILMAHGFPNKNRPPTRLSNASSQPNLRATAQNQQDPRLPPFARNLPQDPYNIGASIVHPANRTSLAFGAGSDARSVAGGSMYNGMPPSEMPGRRPGGLIGEIMRTEEAKAARKGGASLTFPPQRNYVQADPFRPVSPGGGLLGLGGGTQYNTGGMLGTGMGGGAGQGGGMGGGMGGGVGAGMGGGMGGPMGGMSGGMGMGMGGVPAMPAIGMVGQGPGAQGDAMQMQMANQMHMMNMQMQWMQLQMQQGQQQQQQQQQMLLPPMMGQRPMSMAGPVPAGQFPMVGPQQRTMSMMDSPLAQFQQTGRASYAPSIAPSQRGPMGVGLQAPQGYAPSIAPSERSTVGLPSRYRPVSFHPGAAAGPNGARASTLNSGIGHDWTKKPLGPSHLRSPGDSDDDDETGWEELEKKRKEKRDGWRKKKESGFKGIMSFGSTPAP